jgi:hypothetical protein
LCTWAQDIFTFHGFQREREWKTNRRFTSNTQNTQMKQWNRSMKVLISALWNKQSYRGNDFHIWKLYSDEQLGLIGHYWDQCIILITNPYSIFIFLSSYVILWPILMNLINHLFVYICCAIDYWYPIMHLNFIPWGRQVSKSYQRLMQLVFQKHVVLRR